MTYAGEVGVQESGNGTLIFVYNADSGFVSALKDYVHKAVSPSTYSCKLCAITFGSTGMKRDWKSFIDNLDVPVEFLHRDEFLSLYPSENQQFPAAFIKSDSEIILLISSDEINNSKYVEDLINLVMNKLCGLETR